MFDRLDETLAKQRLSEEIRKKELIEEEKKAEEEIARRRKKIEIQNAKAASETRKPRQILKSTTKASLVLISIHSLLGGFDHTHYNAHTRCFGSTPSRSIIIGRRCCQMGFMP